MDVSTEPAALATDAAAAEAAQASPIGSKVDPQTFAEGYPDAGVVEAEGGFCGASGQGRASAPAAV